MPFLEDHPQKAAPPGGVLLAELQGLVDQGLRFGAGWSTAALIGGRQGVRAAALEALHQSADGPRRQVHLLGNPGGTVPLESALPDQLPHGQGNWPRHGSTPCQRKSVQTLLSVLLRSGTRQNF